MTCSAHETTGTARRAPRGGRALALTLAIGTLSALNAAALPVLPGENSFGTATPAGRGGTVYRVTNLNDSGAGSLRACTDATGPRVCVFEVSGTIRMAKDLVIRTPKLTIAGQTAPSPGILLRGAGIWVKASDVLIQHLRVRVGDDPSGPLPENRDALKIDHESTIIRNIVIDHCSFSWAIDETATAWVGWNDISLLNSIFAEPLHDSLHPKGPHGYGVLFGPQQANIALSGNLLAHAVSRNPLSNASQVVIVNNVIYNWKNMAVDLQSQSGLPTYNTIVGNVFIRGADYSHNLPVVLRVDENKVPLGSKVFLSDNVAQEATPDPWSIAGGFDGDPLDLRTYKILAPSVWPANMLRMPTAENATVNHVLKFAGARPADRDAVDRRIIEQVRTRTGRIINCVAPNGTARCERNGGGWPVLAQNRRALTLPENPHTVTASGYTNLELWLHGMAAQVEGRSSPPVAPALKN